MALSLQNIIGGNVGELFSKIVGTFKLSPEKAAEMEMLKETHAVELQRLEIELEKNAQDSVSREIEAASANIRAEAATGDPLTQRARPSFLYLCYGIFGFAYVVAPLIRFYKYGVLEVMNIPSELLWLFAAGYLGYAGFREVGKILSLPGASTVKLPGILLQNDGSKGA